MRVKREAIYGIVFAFLIGLSYSSLVLAADTDYEMAVIEGTEQKYEITYRDDDLLNDSLSSFPFDSGRTYMDGEVGDTFTLTLDSYELYNSSVNITVMWSNGSLDYTLQLDDDNIDKETGSAILRMAEFIPIDVSEFLSKVAATTGGTNVINASAEDTTVRIDVNSSDSDVYAIFQYKYSNEGILQECQIFDLDEDLFYRFESGEVNNAMTTFWMLLPLFLIIGLFSYAMYYRNG